jgi:hypothetical protein
MNTQTRIFICYTRRDGLVTHELLERIYGHLSGVCNPFIHAIEEKRLASQQTAVLRALVRSHVVLVLESPGLQQSPWASIELWLGRLLLIPIIRINVAEIWKWK